MIDLLDSGEDRNEEFTSGGLKAIR